MKKTGESKKLQLKVLIRTELGKKVKQLRKKGVIPCNIYGPDIKSIAISVDHKEFTPIHKASGETGIVYLEVDGKTIPTLIREIARHSVSNEILHVDFREINLKEKIETEVPILVEGESIAVEQLSGVLLTQAGHLMIEALPEKIPAHIIIDISKITELGQEIKVSDLTTSSDYVIKEEPDKVIVSVVEHKEESLEAETERTETEITTEKAGETAVGEESGVATDEEESTKEEKKKE